MATTRLWTDEETALLIYGYLYCPVPFSINKKAPWVSDCLYTLKSGVRRTVPEIMNKIEELQRQGQLPLYGAKLPGEYGRGDAAKVWEFLFSNLQERYLESADRFAFAAGTFCKVSDHDTLDTCIDRLCWFLDHLSGRGSFQLWSEGLRAAILRLYEARADASNDGDKNVSNGIVSSRHERRKYSNEDILKDAAVDAAWTDICPPIFLDKTHLHYFFLDHVIQGDTSTRKKRLEYYYSSDPPPQPLLGTNLERLQSHMISSLGEGAPQQIMGQRNLINAGWNLLPFASSPYVQMPIASPSLPPMHTRASHVMSMPDLHCHWTRPQAATFDRSVYAANGKGAPWSPVELYAGLVNPDGKILNLSPGIMPPARADAPSSQPGLATLASKNLDFGRHQDVSSSPSCAFQPLPSQIIKVGPVMRGTQPGAGNSGPVHRWLQIVPAVPSGQLELSRPLSTHASPTHLAIMAPRAQMQPTPRTNQRPSNGASTSGHRQPLPQLILEANRDLGADESHHAQPPATPIFTLGQATVNGSADNHTRPRPAVVEFDASLYDASPEPTRAAEPRGEENGKD